MPHPFSIIIILFCALRTMRGAKLIIFCLFATFLLFFLSNVTEKDAVSEEKKREKQGRERKMKDKKEKKNRR